MKGPSTPPRFADWLLRHAVPPGVRGDTVLGDLREEFASRTRAGGRAAWWYRTQALTVAGRYALLRLRRPTSPHTDDRILSETSPMLIETVLYDIRYAARTLVKTPAFTFVLLTTLALGIGASTAIFSIVDGIVLRPLPFTDSDRLVFANETNASDLQISVSWPNYVDWRQRAQSFTSLAASQPTSYTLTGVTSPVRLNGRRVTADFFDVLGVGATIGRTFEARDFDANAEASVILSDAFWKSQFGSDRSVIGRTIRLDAASHTIIGVLPPRMPFTRADDVYTRLVPDTNSGILDRGNHQGVTALGRLRPGVTIEAAGKELKGIAAQLTREYPGTNSGISVAAVSLAERLVTNVRQTLLVLLGAVLLLLLIACVNVANLLVARGASRQHELAVRAALGGGRLRLVRQLLVESTLISAVGGALGVVLAWGLVKILVALAPEGTPRIEDVGVNTTTLMFALAASAACGILFGIFPAVQASSARGQHVLIRARGQGGAAAHSHRIRRALMAIEVALALILLVGATLMGRTFFELTHVDPGFNPSGVVTGRFTLAGDQWTAPKRVLFFDELGARLRRLPGVIDAGFAYSLPIDGSNWNSVFIVADKPVPPRAELPSAAFTPVSTGYFQTLQIALKRGRLFDATDHADAPRVTVINETLARKLWPNEDPIGKRLKQGWPETPSPWREVVGLVADVKLQGVAAASPMQAYLPIVQEPSRAMALVVRTAGDPKLAVKPIEAEVHALDKDLPLYLIRTFPEMMDGDVARERVSVVIFVVFSVVAVVLASVGLYGVVAHGVTERIHEIGVRMALGASAADVLRLFVRQGLTTTIAGAVIGVAGALALSQFVEKLLFGVKPNDPVTLMAVVLALVAVSAAACYLPARRATRVNPTAALRTE